MVIRGRGGKGGRGVTRPSQSHSQLQSQDQPQRFTRSQSQLNPQGQSQIHQPSHYHPPPQIVSPPQSTTQPQNQAAEQCGLGLDPNLDTGSYSCGNDHEDHGSNDNPHQESPEVDSHQSNGNGEGRRVRGRGPTRCNRLATMRPDERILVELENGRPVGLNAQKLVTQVSCWVKQRNHFPLQVRNFKSIPEETKERFWIFVQDKFEMYPLTSQNKKKFFKWCAQTYRRNRRAMKKIYKKYNSDRVRLQHRPLDATQADWEYLVKLFGSDDHQAESTRNSTNRGKRKTKQTSGSVSYGRLRRSEREKTGVDPDPISFFKKTHTKKDGAPVDETAAEMMNAMDKLNTEVQEGSCSLTQSEIVHQVWGPDSRGYCKNYGLGMTPTDLYGSTRQNSREEILERELQEQRSRHEEEMTTVQEKIRSEMQAEVQAEVQIQVQAQVAAFMQQMMPTQPTSNDHLPQVQVGAQFVAFMQMMRESVLPQETSNVRVG